MRRSPSYSPLAGSSLDRILLVVAGSLLLTSALGILDMRVGSRWVITPFHLVPIVLTTFYAGRWVGFAFAGVATATWTVSRGDLSMSTDPLRLAGNATIWLGFFLSAAMVVSQLRRALMRERARAGTDFLTGVGNLRTFYANLRRAMAESARSQRPFTLAYIDLDNFKEVNDGLGHLIGDELLCIVAATIEEALVEPDTVARLGGDEFAVLLPAGGTPTVIHQLTALRGALLGAMHQRDWPVTFSIGAVTFVEPREAPDDVVKAADNLMYLAKQRGKDTIVHMMDDELGNLAPETAATPPLPSASLPYGTM